MTGVFIKTGEDTKRHRKEGGVKMEAEIRVKHLQAKGSQGLIVTTRN